MTTLQVPPKMKVVTMGDLLDQLGDVPPNRVRLYPVPGTATVDDVIAVEAREDVLCELVDGVLVEKPVGLLESLLAGLLLTRLWEFVRPRNLGIVTGEAGMMRLLTTLVRIPDVAYLSWDRLPGRRIPREPVPDVVPDLAVEVLSPSNTAREMGRKLQEYFEAGVRLVWIIDPRRRTCAVHTAPEQPVVLTAADVLDGGPALPGFQLRLADLFAELDRTGDAPAAP